MPRHLLSSIPTDQVTIAPSILAADFSCLGDEIRNVAAAGADIIHIDVMDGHLVPNLSMGPAVLASISECCDLPYDVHLMITDPDQYIDSFVKAGADHITFHVEVDKDIHDIIRQIKAHGITAGLSLKPGTPAETIFPYLDEIDLILVMSVEPGFGGQSFMDGMMPKVAAFRNAIEVSGRSIHLEIDGGIGPATAPVVVANGARMLVAGTSVFRAKEGMAEAIRLMRANS